MKKRVTVSQALKRAQWSINGLAFICMTGSPILGIYLYAQKLIPAWGIGVMFMLGFLLAWLMWSLLITKWKVWAFENVRNVHELKRKAIETKVIWPDDSIFNKTEIWTSSDRRKWEHLQKKFNRNDVYKEDRNVPPKTEIFYSKLKFLDVFWAILLTAFGIIMTYEDEITFGLICTVIGILLGLSKFSQATNKEVQIYMDHKGMKTIDTTFKKWSEIKNERIEFRARSKGRSTYLVYEYDHESVEIQIDDFAVSVKRLENAMRTYRVRFQKNKR